MGRQERKMKRAQLQAIEVSITTILHTIEESTKLRSGIIETPNRVARAYAEMFDGYTTDIDSLFKTFEDEGIDQIVVLKDIGFTSVCEHHMLPFSGYAHVAYLPNGKVIGASKIPRLVLAYAHRLQIQERITQQVSEALMEKLKPLGVAVIIEATHLCMKCRGVKSEEGKLVTSVMLGKFREDINVKQEVLSLLGILK